jgi:branched-chain amino acid transport system substrate-binding protein
LPILLVSALVAAGACSSGGKVEFETRALAPAAGAAPGASAGQPATPAVSGGLLPATSASGGAGSSPAGRSGPAGVSAPGQQRRPAGPIKLGTVLPLQGGQRSFGEPVLRTTQAFVDELNERGGIGGARLELIAYNACLTCQDEALQATRRLVEKDGVFALVNTYPMVIAFQPVIAYLVSKGVPLIQGGAENQTTDALTPINFATAPTGLFYVRFLAVMTRKYAGLTRVGLTYLNVPTEAHGVPQLKRELAKQGVQVVDEEPVAAAEEAVTNMDSIVTRMRARGAQGALAINPVLLIYGRLAASRQAWNVPWVGEAAWSRLVEDSCGGTCDDLVLTDTAGLSYVDRDTPQMHQYKDTLARRYPGGEFTGHTLAAWVAMQLVTEVLVKTGPDRRAFLQALEHIRNLDLGTNSPLTFTPDRHLGGSASVLLRLKGGKYIRVSEPLNFGEAPP